jgi:two-component system CheB/CheR fusion protein
LINDLLDVTKMSDGQLKLTCESVDLAELLQERVGELGPTTNHRFQVETETTPPVFADRERMGQVITNLVSNAIKYSPQGTTITSGVRQADGCIELSVRDEGCGIAKEDQKKIFDRFFRGSSNNHLNTFPGMGLGLFITAQIVERHNGRIWVDSRLGSGSTFYVAIPV